MKPGIVEPNVKPKDRIVRWVGFLALVALLAMATFPITSAQRDIAAGNTTHWSGTWHG